MRSAARFIALTVAGALVTASVAMAQGSGQQAVPTRRAAPAMSAIHNPSFLHATELLGPALPGVGRRVRFEWEPVLGCAEYVLTGQWTDGHSWALNRSEYRVTTRTASSWQARRVTFDVSLPEGTHSWKLVAVFGPNGTGDFENPAQLSFDVK